MTLKEYKQKNPEMFLSGYFKEYDEDMGSFGRKGCSAYGNCDSLQVIDIIMKNGIPKFILVK